LGILADNVYSNPQHYNGISLVIATVFSLYQIYCDFSGYTDIARGAACVMGIKLMLNFNYPFNSKTVAEFWTRWHISLSTWFRDYMYMPLSRKHRGVPAHLLIVFSIFLLVGLWHGANWTFVIWGALNGVYLMTGTLTRKPWKAFRKAIGIGKFSGPSIIGTFSLIAFSMIFFKSNTIANAFYIAGHVFTSIRELFHFHHLQFMGVRNSYLVFSVGLIAFLELLQYLQRNYSIMNQFLKQPVYIRWTFYYVALLVIGVYGIYEHRQFIYFQF